MQTSEVGLALRGDEVYLPFLSRVMPAFGDLGGVVRRIGRLDLAKTDLGHDLLVFAGRAVDVEADRAASGDFLMRDQSANDKSIAEKHFAAGFEYAKDFAKDCGTTGEMTQHVVGEYGVEGVVFEWKFFRGIALLESHL